MSAQPPASRTAAHPRARPLGQPGVARFRGRFVTALDYAAAGLLAVIIFTILARRAGAFGVLASPLGWLPRILFAAALAAATACPVAFRRRRPVAAMAVVLSASAVILAAGGAVTLGPILPLALVLYMVAAMSRPAAAGYGLAVSLALLVLQGIREHAGGVGSGRAVAAGLVLIIVWTVGYAVRQRRAYTARLRDQAASQIAAAAVTEERLRIARELHDVVAHSMTVAAVQAGFGAYVFDSQPAKARAALAAIQTVTRDALTDMQRLLGVLRQAETPGGAAMGGAGLDGAAHRFPAGSRVADGGPAAVPPAPGAGPAGAQAGTAHRAPAVRAGTAPLRPAPGLADLDRLVSATEGAGVTVAVQRSGQARPIAAGTDLSAFRIVQEALTNVVKHSGASTCRVSLGYGTRELSIEITDPGWCGDNGTGLPDQGMASGNGSRAGHGLIGMRERVSLCQGEFSAAALPGGGFRVWARLPLVESHP